MRSSALRSSVTLLVGVLAALCVWSAAPASAYEVTRFAYRVLGCPTSTTAGQVEKRVFTNRACTALSATTSVFVDCTFHSGGSPWAATEYHSTNDCTGPDHSRVFSGNDETKCDNTTVSGFLSQRIGCGLDCYDLGTQCAQCQEVVGCAAYVGQCQFGGSSCVASCQSNTSCSAANTCTAASADVANTCTGGGDGPGNGGSGSGGSTGDRAAIAGVTVGGVALIGIAVGVYFCYFRKRSPTNTTASGALHPEAVPMQTDRSTDRSAPSQPPPAQAAPPPSSQHQTGQTVVVTARDQA